MGDFHRVYLYLIEVMRAGYRMCGKTVTVDETHTALRTVWGRSKQLKNEDDTKKRKQKLLEKERQNTKRPRRRH